MSAEVQADASRSLWRTILEATAGVVQLGDPPGRTRPYVVVTGHTSSHGQLRPGGNLDHVQRALRGLPLARFPDEASCLLVVGAVPPALAPRLRALLHRIPSPRPVVSVPFALEGEETGAPDPVGGAASCRLRDVLPVDTEIHGCPPPLDALQRALFEVRPGSPRQLPPKLPAGFAREGPARGEELVVESGPPPAESTPPELLSLALPLLTSLRLSVHVAGDRVLGCLAAVDVPDAALETPVESAHELPRRTGLASSTPDPAATLATALALEELGRHAAPARARWLRVLHVELWRAHSLLCAVERLDRELGDCTGVGTILRALEDHLADPDGLGAGERAIVMGGVERDPSLSWLGRTDRLASQLARPLHRLHARLQTRPLATALRTRGRVDGRAALALGGPCARAAGHAVDHRDERGSLPYASLQHRTRHESGADALARTSLRVLEASDALWLAARAADGLPGGSVAAPIPLPEPGVARVSVEGARGLTTVTATCADGRVRVELVSPARAVLESLPRVLPGSPLDEVALIVHSLDPDPVRAAVAASAPLPDSGASPADAAETDATTTGPAIEVRLHP